MSASSRIARRMAPRVALASHLRPLVERCANDDRCGVAGRCADQLKRFGEMAETLLADRRLLDAVAAGQGDTRPHPALVPFARWLAAGSPGPLELWIPPYAAVVVRGIPPAVLEVVSVKVLPGAQAHAAFAAIPFPNARPVPDHDISVDLVFECDRAATEAIAAIVDPDRKLVLGSLVGIIFDALVLAGLRLAGEGVEPSLNLELIEALVDALGQRLSWQVFRVRSHGMEIAFELAVPGADTLPLRVLGVYDLRRSRNPVAGRRL